MATQKQRADATRAQLLKAFRASFLRFGYDATTTQHVLAETGLSKGAMYHHFQSKAEIAEAIYARESRSAIERAIKHVETISSASEKLRGACLAWTREVRVPRVSKILFDIGPSALGPKRAKEIEDSFSLKLIEQLLDKAVAQGEIGATDTKLIAVFLNSLVAEAALYTLRTGNESADVLDAAIDALMVSLRP